MSRFVPGCIAVVALAVAACGVGGCSQNADLDDVSYHAISRNMTPEVQGMSERPIDIDRNMRWAMNQNLRMMWGDLGRAFMVDRPSSLTPSDAISTSGQPR